MLNRRGAHPGALFLSLVLAVTLLSCGGGSPTATVPSNPAQVVSEGSTSVGAGGSTIIHFTTGAAGTLAVAVDWTSAGSLFMSLARGNCSELDIDGLCPSTITTFRAGTVKPERRVVPSQQAGTYSLVVSNLGFSLESVSWQVVLQQ